MTLRLRKPRAAFLLTGIATVVALLWWAVRPVPVYDSTEVRRGNIRAVVAATGTLEPRNYVDVGAQVSGQITGIHVEPGDLVKRGQLLVEIDASIHEATVEAGRAQLASLKAQLADQNAQLDLADLQLERKKTLLQDGVANRADVDTALAAFKSARARAASLEAQIRQTASRLKGDEAQLSYTRVYAPMAGTVLTVDAREGQTLNATYQTPSLLRIADLSLMTVRANVAEADIRRIEPGMDVSFTTLGEDDRTWHAQVRQVLPAPITSSTDPAEPGIVQYVVLFDVTNADSALLPQMTAQVTFVTASRGDALIAPLADIAPTMDGSGSYTARVLAPSGQPEQRTLRVGTQDRMYAEVLDGLQAGDRVISGDAVFISRWRTW